MQCTAQAADAQMPIRSDQGRGRAGESGVGLEAVEVNFL